MYIFIHFENEIKAQKPRRAYFVNLCSPHSKVLPLPPPSNFKCLFYCYIFLRLLPISRLIQITFFFFLLFFN